MLRVQRGLNLLLCVVCAAFSFACGSSSETTDATSTLAATITASTGLTSFTYHGNTAYYVSFGDAGVTLSGATSTDANGNAVSTYSWEQISGPTVSITPGTTSASLVFDVPAITSMLESSESYRWQFLPISRDDYILKFRLTVNDANGNADKSTFSVYLYDNDTQIIPTNGIGNVGVGETVYMSGPSRIAKAASPGYDTIANWAWAVTAAPGGSAAALSSGVAQIISFIPDVAGTYTITYSTTSSAQAAANGTLTINAASYVGVGTVAGTTSNSSIGQCGACHTTTEESWDDTGHSVQFQQVISSYASKAPQPYCWECHTVGYDTRAVADNGGFDDLVTDAGYAFPSAGTTWDAFVADNPTLAVLTNIQCENCHGPGSRHLGDTDDNRIDYENWKAGMCGRCHSQDTEWKISAHNSTGVVGTSSSYQRSSWPGISCNRCHSSGGFVQHVQGEAQTAQTADWLVACQACHDPHSQGADAVSGSTAVSGNDSTQLRLKGEVTMKDDDHTVVDAGLAAVCYECHDGNYTYDEDDCDSDGDGAADHTCDTMDQIATQYRRTIHGNPQSMVLEGVGALTDEWTGTGYDFTLTENSFHSGDLFTLRYGTGNESQTSENNKCVTCHMGTAPTDEQTGYRLIGGHTWKMSNGDIEFTASCTPCHAGLTALNRTARADYDGDGTVEGIQDEVKGLLLALANKILALDASSGNLTGGTTEADGVITADDFGYPSQAAMNLVNIDLKRAAFNHDIIADDKSLGLHNTAFAVQVLQKTYTAISTMNGGNSFATDYPNAAIR